MTANPLSQSEIIPMLSRVSIFTGVDIIELKLLADRCVFEYFKTDEKVIEQDEPGDKLYIIVRGTVAVWVKSQTLDWQRINTLGPGDVFGEIAILRNVPRTARIITLTNCQFLSICAKDFLDLYQYFPARARDNIQLVVAKRLQERGLYINL